VRLPKIKSPRVLENPGEVMNGTANGKQGRKRGKERDTHSHPQKLILLPIVIILQKLRIVFGSHRRE